MEGEWKEIIVDVSDNVGTVRLNRGAKGNSITPQMGSELHKAFQQLEGDNRVRVIVLTGNGKYFCTGADLSSASASGSATPFVDVLQTVSIHTCVPP
jgi:enoyl-CoA hydratase/carnithine racemase